MVSNKTDEIAPIGPDAPDASDNFLDALKQMVPEEANLYVKIASLEERAGISVSDYLAFGAIDDNLKQQLKVRKGKYGIYYGERSEDNLNHGKGIYIESNGDIYINYFADDA